MKGKFPLDRFQDLETPFYYYDLDLLRQTLHLLTTQASQYGYHTHYAVKANANAKILSIIREKGLGADCVSGGEIKAALQAGFPASKIVFAGVGKADWEIKLALTHSIFCFNAESMAELEVINQIALEMGKKASIALRINPDVLAHTHSHITTGLKENKFGIALTELDQVIDQMKHLPALSLIGLHFHIGSQIVDMTDFVALCNRINQIQAHLQGRHVSLAHINVGGGLGIDYQHPNRQSIPPLKEYFEVFHKFLKLYPGQTLHFEPGRSLVGQCGSLITKVLYIKQGINKQFAIVDAGMNDLIRPAMYQAFHKIENISSDKKQTVYDIVGPICESSDVFAKSYDLNQTERGDLLAIRSAGAYGEIMASRYNMREFAKAYFSDDDLKG